MLRKAVRGAVVLIGLWASCAASVQPGLPGPSGRPVRVSEGIAAGLHYIEVVPAGASSGARLPMVVWLHGRGDVPRPPAGSFLGLEEPMRLILFRAPDPFERGYTWLPVSASPGESPALVAALVRRSAQIARAIGQLERERPTRGLPIVMGFSQGAMLTMTLAVHHPDVVGAAFPLSGWLPPSLSPSTGPNVLHPPILAMHGVDDDTLPIERTRHAVARLRRQGYDISLLEYRDAGHVMTRGMWVQLRKWLRAELRSREPSDHPGRPSIV